MKYARLKTTNGTGTIMRYFDLAEGQKAEANNFYEVVGGVAKILADEAKPTGNIIGFSHGGDKLVKGKIFLDINPAVVYVAQVESAEALPTVNTVIDGYKKVIDVHTHDLTYEFVIGDAGATAVPNPEYDDVNGGENDGESEGNE